MDIIRILNIEEYNPRKDRKKHSWFRVDNTIPFSKKLEGLHPDQKWCWICLIALASFEQRDWIECDIQYFKKHVGINEKRIMSALKHFKNKEMIQIVPRSDTERLPVGDRAGTSGVPTDRQTDVTDDTLQTDVTTQQNDEVQIFFEFWNSLVTEPELPKVVKLTSERRKKIRTRLQEASLEDWKSAMLEIGKIPFLLGDGGNGWRADFDWFIENETNRVKIIEGKYSRKFKQKSTAEKNFDVIADQARRVKEGTL